jgi:cell division septation protein DedD
MIKVIQNLRKVVAIAICLASSATLFAQETGVKINGVTWATRNVDAPGTFAEKPESAGMLYHFDQKTVFYNAINEGKPANWDSELKSPNKEWTKENDPSPEGWRVPTPEELKKLLDESKVTRVWSDTKKGFTFTDKATGAAIFLPSAGSRNHNGYMVLVGRWAYYSSNQLHSSGKAQFLSLSNDWSYPVSYPIMDNSYTIYVFSVRPVKIEQAQTKEKTKAVIDGETPTSPTEPPTETPTTVGENPQLPPPTTEPPTTTKPTGEAPITPQGNNKKATEEAFSLEGLNPCQKAEKLISLKTPAKPIKEGIYKPEEFCQDMLKLDMRMTGKANDLDNAIFEGKIFEGNARQDLRKLMKRGFEDFEKTAVKFEKGKLYAIENGKIHPKVQTYEQEGEVITVYSEEGDVAGTFYYKEGILFQSATSEDDVHVAIIFKKIE